MLGDAGPPTGLHAVRNFWSWGRGMGDGTGERAGASERSSHQPAPISLRSTPHVAAVASGDVWSLRPTARGPSELITNRVAVSRTYFAP